MSLKSFGLIPQQRFWPVMATQTLGTFNDNGLKWGLLTLANFFGVTLMALNKDQTINIASLMFTIPMMLVPAFAGKIADRTNKDTVMRRAKFAEIFLMAFAGAGLVMQNIWMLMATLFLMGVQSAFYAPARTASLPHYLEDEELISGNAILNGALSLFILIGTIVGMTVLFMANGRWILAGALVSVAILGWLASRYLLSAPSDRDNLSVTPTLVLRLVFTTIITVAVVGALFLYVETRNLPLSGGIAVGALTLWGLTRFLKQSEAGPRIDGDFLWDFVELIIELSKNPGVFRPLLGVAWYWAASTVVVTMLPIYLNDNLGYGQSVVTTVFVLFVVCGALGAIICAALNQGKDGMVFTFVGGMGLALFSLDLYLGRETGIFTDRGGITEFIQDPQNVRFLIDCAGAAIFGGMFTVPLVAMAQRRANPAKRGRLLSGMTVLNAIGATTGLIILIIINEIGFERISALVPVIFVTILISLYAGYRMLRPTKA